MFNLIFVPYEMSCWFCASGLATKGHLKKKIFSSSHVFSHKPKIKRNLMRSLFLCYCLAENSGRLLSPFGFPRIRPRGRLMISLASFRNYRCVAA